MVEKYHELQSSLKVIEAWIEEFPLLNSPSPSTILRNVHNHGSVDELPRTRLKINATKEKAKNELKDLIDENPTISIRKAASAVGLSYGSTQSIMKEDLHLKPYKLQECHQLQDADHAKRLFFS
jgi:hypothetical protein